MEHSTIKYDDNVAIHYDVIALPLRKIKGFKHKVFEGGICNKNYKFLYGYIRTKPFKADAHLQVIRSYKIHNTKLDNINESVVYAGILYNHFGNFITDCLSRLWYVAKYNNHNLKILFLAEDNSGLLEYQISLLKLLGIDSERIIILQKPATIKQIIVPVQAWLTFAAFNCELFNITYDFIIKNAEHKPYEKIYLSRSKFEKKDLFNEKYFEDFFSDMSFKILYPEKLHINDQVSYIASAKEIACTSGTLSHLSLFAKPNTKLICLLRTKDLNRQQSLISYAKNLNYVYIDVSINIFLTRYTGCNYLIGPTPYWKNFLKNEYDIDDNTDIFKNLNSTDINIGSYIQKCIRSMPKLLDDLENPEVTYKTYSRSLMLSFYPELENNCLFIKSKNFLICYKNKKTKITLNEDQIIHFKNDNFIFSVKYWAIHMDNLFFLDENSEPIIQFNRDIKETKISRWISGGGLKFIGRHVMFPDTVIKLKEII